MFKNLGFKKAKARKNRIKIKSQKIDIPDDLYSKCSKCESTINKNDIKENNYKCTKCNNHFRLRSKTRIDLTFDSFVEEFHRIGSKDPLKFPGYKKKIDELEKKQGIKEAVIVGDALIHDISVEAIIMDSHFMMGSMGVAVGEKITKAFERAMRLKKPVVLFSCSGGARMQEGMFSLMQMAKTCAVVEKFNESGGLFINVITDPTTGGVSASFSMIADIVLAEPQALIGFAGPRVIEQTINQQLPDGFQSAEFALECGFIDKVVDRDEMKETLYQLLKLHEVK